MRFPSYLVLSRHNIYYFRFPLAEALHPQGKRTDIKISLNTRCPKQAMYLSHALAYAGHSLLTSLFCADMDYSEIREIITNHFLASRDRIKERIGKYGRLTDQEKRSYISTMQLAKDALENNDFSLIGRDDELLPIIRADALPIKEGSEDYQVLRREYVTGQAS